MLIGHIKGVILLVERQYLIVFGKQLNIPYTFMFHLINSFSIKLQKRGKE